MNSFVNLLKPISVQVMLGQFVLWLILLLYIVRLSRRVARIASRDSRGAAENGSAEDEWARAGSSAVSNLQAKIEDTCERQREQARSLTNCIQRIGLVRFNAFDDVGGEQSFALVLLDGKGDGVAISSLYGRQDSRLYAKGIINGEGERPLSEEEQRALEKALPDGGVAGPVRTTTGM